MANATLQAMQEIERAAQSVIEDYEQQIKDLQVSTSSELAALRQTYEQESASELAKAADDYQAQLSDLKAQLETSLSQNKAAVSRGLVDKKDDLVQAIVDKVVENYGN